MTEYLQQWGPRLFPAYFSAALHPFFCSLLPMDADERAAATLAAFPVLLRVIHPDPTPDTTPDPTFSNIGGEGAGKASVADGRAAGEEGAGIRVSTGAQGGEVHGDARRGSVAVEEWDGLGGIGGGGFSAAGTAVRSH